MKRIAYIFILLVTLVGCQDFDVLNGSTIMKDGDIRVSVRIPSFKDVNVTTRGTKSGVESKVTNMYMFIASNDGSIAYRQFETGDKPLFTINRAELETQNPGMSFNLAHIVVVANVNSSVRSALDAAANLEALYACDFALSNETNCVDIPNEGFPMMSDEYEVDLHKPGVSDQDPLKGSVLEIPLKCLFAKVVFNISVKPTQSVSSVDQSFHLKSWKVYNVPTKVNLGVPESDKQTKFAESGCEWVESDVRTTTNKADNLIYESSQESDSLFFEFYVPEHKINPKNTATYPWKPEDADKYLDYRQYLKPTLVQDKTQPTHPCPTDQKAIYVEINGTYKDHNNTERDVTYTIYLGDNNYDNFHLLRNHQYNNSIIIKGIKNSTAVGNENWVTYDHRVNVTQQDFSFGLQRETLLDCHWEIRPIRIDFNQGAGDNSVVEIIVPQDCNWLSIESPSASTISGNAQKYCAVGNTSTAYGKRRYYTINLNSDLNDPQKGGTKTVTIHRNNKNDHTVATLNDAEAHTVWAYIDEFVNTDPGAPRYRYATVKCKYYATEEKYAAHTPDVVEDYIFRQNNVFKIEQNGNTYYIEYYEEYLYNYDTKDQYGGTTDGMAWGLNGVEISHENPAVVFSKPEWTEAQGPIQTKLNPYVEGIMKGISDSEGAKYDFYLSRDLSDIANNSSLKTRDYKGIDFTKDLFEHSGIDIRDITTKDMPSDAVIYCLNRNKRNLDGSIALDNIKWYMPAIDEIEEICIGGYGEFEVFQDKFYWSSQPSYIKNEATFEGDYVLLQGNGKNGTVKSAGQYFADDPSRARATKCYAIDNTGNNFGNVKSGSKYTMGTLAFKHTGYVDRDGNFHVANDKNSSIINPPAASKTYSLNFETDNDGKLILPSDHYDPGNQPRTAINRVRVVYMP